MQNDEQGLTNIVSDVKVLDSVTINYSEEEGTITHMVKFRFSMIDYVTDDSGAVVHGSKDKPETSTEVWTFQSPNGKKWYVSGIANQSVSI